MNYRFNDPGPGADHDEAPPTYARSRPDRGKFGVCYFGLQQETAFVETFLRRPAKRHDIAEAEIRVRRLTGIRLSRPLRLVQLDGPGLHRAGVDGSIISSADYALPRTLARRIWLREDVPDGILYAARHDNHLHAAAIFDRAKAALMPGTAQEIDDDLLRKLILRYGFRLI